MRSIFELLLSAGLWLGIPVASSALGRAESPLKPNIVLVLADDLGWGDLGCYNAESRIPTPSLDRLAGQGMRFTDAHSPSSVCTPTRYALLTGRYAWRTRLKSGVLWGYSPPLVEPGRVTLASVLRDRGYATSCIGKWHLGLAWATREPAQFGDLPEPAASPALVDYTKQVSTGPLTVGFEHSFVLPGSLDMEPYVFVENGRPLGPVTGRVEGSIHQRKGGRGFWRAGPIGPGFTHEGCQPRLLAEAEAFLRRQTRERPFLLYFSLTAPHDPWVPQPEYRGRSKAGDRGDFVVQVDAAVGRILSVLQERGLADNTIVVFASDNGAHWLPDEVEKTGHRANGPWRGQKSDAWEGGHRIPLIVRWPDHVRSGSTSDALVCLSDILATAAEILGLKLPKTAAEDSISFLAVLREQARTARKSLVMHSANGVFAIRRGDWKLIEAQGSGGWSPGEVAESAQLYNLRDDPGEQANHFSDRATIAKRLRGLLRETRSSGRSPRR